MSHIETVSVHIADLEALKAACKRMGVDFREGQKTFVSYTGKNPCEHAIHIEGVLYEIGLVDGKTKVKSWNLAADLDFGPGIELKRKFCKLTEHGSYTHGYENLIDAYSIEVLKRKARAQGYRAVESKLPNGKVKLTVYGAN